MTMDRKEACKILGVAENATPQEIKKARDRLAKIHHTDKGGSNDKIQKINVAYDVLTKDNGDNSNDNSNIDEDAIWKMEQKIKNAFDYNNVKKEEMEDETIRSYEEKLRRCKTKEDLEKFTSEVVFFIQIYARARNAGYFDKKGSSKPDKPKPAPSTENRSDSSSSTNSDKYAEFTCDWCTYRVKSDDPRPKYTFKGTDKAFCKESCRENWDKSDRWWKDWDEKKKKEAQEWEEYKRNQDRKWADYFRNLNNNNYSSYSSFNYTPSSSSSSSGSSSSISSWLDDYKKEREKQKSESLNENIQRYIRDVEHKLSLESVSAEKLNKKLGVSDWKEKISQCSDTWEAMDRKFDLVRIVGELSREYTCANCGAVKNNYYPREKNGKKYCSLDCKDNKKIDDDEAEKLRKEIQDLKDCLKDFTTSVTGALNDLLNWVKKEGVVSLELEGNKLVVKFGDGYKTKTLEENSLTPGQAGIKKLLQKSGKNSMSASEIEKLVGGETNQQGGKDKNNNKNGNVGIIAAVVVVGLILAVIIGVVIGKNKKKDY